MRRTCQPDPLQTPDNGLRLRGGAPAALIGFVLLILVSFAPVARAQAHSADFGLTYTQERNKFANSECGCFWLRGATADFSYNVLQNIGIAGSASGVAATNLRGSIDIEQLRFMVGPRYTFNLGRMDPAVETRKGGIFVEGKVGYTFAFSGLYPSNNNTLTGNASALTYQAGGGVNFHVYRRFDVRVIEADWMRTQLPNGGNNEQTAFRVATGINFHFGR